MDNQLTLIQDTREVLGYGDLFSIPYEVGTIETGDYSLSCLLYTSDAADE